MPPAQVFKLPGVHVVLGNSTDSIVSLRGVDLVSSGRYKCEVSGEAPLFQTVSDHGSMDMPPAQVFKLPGVHVVLGNSTDSIVSLRGVDLVSSGRYKCEVSGEAPLFQTVSDH
uniref:Ig-like domain-containing protein n=1 Tax=Megaselia scalaris TaxID=36166 RepID=T1GXX5_MEGSC